MKWALALIAELPIKRRFYDGTFTHLPYLHSPQVSLFGGVPLSMLLAIEIILTVAALALALEEVETCIISDFLDAPHRVLAALIESTLIIDSGFSNHFL